MSKSKLIKDSLQFACTKCGKCCKGRTNVFVNVAEVEALAKFKGINKFDFVRTFTEDKETPSGLITSLKSNVDKNGGQSCIFLKDNQCSVYEARPTQCRTYPFWPLHLIGEAEWRAEARNCEGITVKSKETAASVSTVPKDEVLTNLIVHMVHDRGLGPDWTYDESRSHLLDSQAQDSNTFSDFESDYFSSHHSEIVFENGNIMIVDTTTPDSSAAANAEADDALAEKEDDKLADGDHFLNELINPNETKQTESSGPTVVNTHRRLEFISLPSVTQSEVKLQPVEDSESGTTRYVVDHSTLSLPVHKVIAEVFLKHMMPLFLFSLDKKSKKNDALSPIRMLMIGAGGCVLPSHIQHQLTQQSDQPLQRKVTIDAVEPDGDIIKAAEDYFGAVFDSERLRPLVVDGASYLVNHNKSSDAGSYDVIVIDAFEPLNKENSSTDATGNVSATARSRAPPVSLIDHSDDVITALLNKSVSASAAAPLLHGLVVINVFGDKQWLLKTMSKFNISNGFCKPIVIVIGNSEVVSENNYVLITTPMTTNKTEKPGKINSGAKSNFAAGAKSNFAAAEKSTTGNSSAGKGLGINVQSSCARLDEITHGLTGSMMFAHQVVNDGVIFVYNGDE